MKMLVKQSGLPTELLFNSSSINACIKWLQVVVFVMPDINLGSPHIQIGISSSTYGDRKQIKDNL